jgi:hypothetical protein
MAMRKYLIFILIPLSILLIVLVGWSVSLSSHPPIRFNGQRAFQDVIAQVEFGPRTPDSQAHADALDYIQK